MSCVLFVCVCCLCVCVFCVLSVCGLEDYVSHRKKNKNDQIENKSKLSKNYKFFMLTNHWKWVTFYFFGSSISVCVSVYVCLCVCVCRCALLYSHEIYTRWVVSWMEFPRITTSLQKWRWPKKNTHKHQSTHNAWCFTCLHLGLCRWAAFHLAAIYCIIHHNAII